MPFSYYDTNQKRLDAVPEDLTLPQISQEGKNKSYKPHPDLVDAVNVALRLGQPLLVTGDPGTGKTQLAHSVNWQIGFRNPEPFVFETKSTSSARDLFYTYDAIGRFHAAQNAQIEYQRLKILAEENTGGTASNAQKDKISLLSLPKDNPVSHIAYNAFGMAILLANEWETARKFLPFYDEKISAQAQFEQIKSHASFAFLREIKDDEGKTISAETTLATWQRRSVVLIDEIDKAPRDFPNDILNEIERMFFRIPELGGAEISVPNDKFRPVVILTSNSEKNLPDAFLRRCAYYHIEFPKPEQLREIVVGRLFSGENNAKLPPDKWLNDALQLFADVRKRNLFKNPATAELLGWITALKSDEYNNQYKEFKNLSGEERRKFINLTLSILTKNESDREKAKSIPLLKPE